MMKWIKENIFNIYLTLSVPVAMMCGYLINELLKVTGLQALLFTILK